MKKALQSSEYILLPHAFKEWLQLLNYSGGSVQVLPGHVQEFLYYQELQNYRSINWKQQMLQRLSGICSSKPVSERTGRLVRLISTSTSRH